MERSAFDATAARGAETFVVAETGESRRPEPEPKPEPPTYLKILDVTKKFGDFTALDAVSIDIFESEFICFLGPSGCGKTTLLRAIAGLEIQTSGTVRQAGRDISRLPPAARNFGIVFQSYALFPNLTVAKNVGYGLQNEGRPRAEIQARVRELLALVGLSDQAHKYPAQLSGGQQQRVALARAMATSPGLLLLDEPLSALDARVRVRLRHEVKELQRKLGVTTIMVTHDQEEALTMADRIVVMNQGVIEQVGTPVDVYRHPASAFVADFIGTMNFVPGKVVACGKVACGTTTLSCDTRDFAPGARVLVGFRPEDIVANGIAEGHHNSFEVTIDWMEFLGSFFRATLGGGPLTDLLPESPVRADFSINFVRQDAIDTGRTIRIQIPDHAIRLYAFAPSEPDPR